MLLCFVVLQVLLILSTECYSININYKENKTTNIKITIPISSKGIGAIKIDEITSEDDNCGDQTNVSIPIDTETETVMLPEAIDINDSNDTVTAPDEEHMFEGPVRASGTINILGNFGPTISGEPFIYPKFQPQYPIYSPASNVPNSPDASEQEDPRTINSSPTPYPYYRPVPLYPLFSSITRDLVSSEESDLIEYPMYRKLPLYPVCPPLSNDPNQTTDMPAQSKEPLTLNDDTRRLLRNLLLLNVAHQSNIPCEVVPVPPTNRTAPEDECEPTENGIDDGNDVAPSIVPVSGKVTIVATSL